MILTCVNCGEPFESIRSKRLYCSVKCSGEANGRKRLNEEIPLDQIVFSSGGGIQSTAIAVLIEQGKLPKPTLSLMVDVGYECGYTLDYMRDETIPRLAAVGVRMDIVDTLCYTSNDLIDRNGMVKIPAYRKNPDGSVDKLRTYCNGEWKQRVTRKYARDNGITGCVNWIGISTDEARRATGNSSLKWMKTVYPLIDMGLSREDCVQLIKRASWPMPQRSACVCCPSHTDREWLIMKYEHPEDFKRALEIDKLLREQVPNVFLHKQCTPLEDVF